MHKFLFLLFALFIIHTLNAQYKLVSNTTAFTAAFTEASAKTNSIVSNFTQVKTLALLSEKLSSKGKFYFQKNDKVRMEYTSPFQYLMIINGSKVFIKDGEKTNTLNSKSNKMFQQINQLMMDCMSGNIFGNKNFSVRLFEDADNYLAEMTPQTGQLKSMFKKVNVILKKSNYIVSQVQMFEPGGDYTSLNYTNQQINTRLSDALFSVK
ncbi:MAG: LolA family protein [Niabella sp.]